MLASTSQGTDYGFQLCLAVLIRYLILIQQQHCTGLFKVDPETSTEPGILHHSPHLQTTPAITLCLQTSLLGGEEKWQLSCYMNILYSYHALSTEEIRDNFFIDVIQQSPRTLVVISSINKEFFSSVIINEWTNLQRKKNRTDQALTLFLSQFTLFSSQFWRNQFWSHWVLPF